MNCKTYRFLYRAVPINPFRSYLIAHHLAHCPQCLNIMTGYTSDHEVNVTVNEQLQALKQHVITPGTVKAQGINLWPNIQDQVLTRIDKKEKIPHYSGPLSRPRSNGVFANKRNWGRVLAVSAALLLIAVVSVLLVFNPGQPDDHNFPAVNQGNIATVNETPGDTHNEILVKSLKVDNQPARAFYFQSKEPGKIIVWVQKGPQKRPSPKKEVDSYNI